jgi:HAD-superfamily hydrolase, subfamily IIB
LGYKMVFLDVDGTLLNEEKNIPADTQEAVASLMRNGIEVAFATGRAPYHLRRYAEQLGIRSYIAYNGAYAVHNGKVLYDRPMYPDPLRKLARIADAARHPLVYFGKENCYASHGALHPDLTRTFSKLKLDLPCGPYSSAVMENIYQVMLFCPETDDRLYESIPELQFLRGDAYYVDVCATGETKANGIRQMISRLGIAPGEIVAFGDGVNDIEMLEFAGMGIAMGNAPPAVQASADWVTGTADEGGIVHALLHLQLI